MNIGSTLNIPGSYSLEEYSCLNANREQQRECDE